MTKHSAKPDVLIEAIETGRLPYVDTHPLYRTLIKHKAFLVSWLCDALSYKPKADSFVAIKVSPEYQQLWKNPTKQALACNGHENKWIVDKDKGIVMCAHIKPRKTLFVPTSQSCPVPLEKLSTKRHTVMQSDANTVTSIVDEWKPNQVGNRSQPIYHWCGYTLFWLNQ